MKKFKWARAFRLLEQTKRQQNRKLQELTNKNKNKNKKKHG